MLTIEPCNRGELRAPVLTIRGYTIYRIDFVDTFAVGLLQKGVSLELASTLLGHKNILVTQRLYSLWVKSRQIALEEAVKAALK